MTDDCQIHQARAYLNVIKLIKEFDERWQNWQLYRTRFGWGIMHYEYDYSTRVSRAIVDYAVDVDYKTASEVYTVYQNEEKVPVCRWLEPFNIFPSKRNGAAKAFVHYFKKGFDPGSIKRNTDSQLSMIIGHLFKEIAKDYPEWALSQKILTFTMIWKSHKKSLPGYLPRDIVKMICEYVKT